MEQGGWNGLGPGLHGVFGQRPGAVEGFRSGAPRPPEGLSREEATMRACVAESNAVVPGVSMSCPGMRHEPPMNDLWAFLRRATGAPEPS
jgi:cytochrome c